MTIKIRRASGRSEEKQPCEGAVKQGNDWLITLGKLEDLFLLADKESSLIVYADEIVIYDDYVE